MAILVLFKQFLRQILFNFLAPILSLSPNMMHFVRAFRFMLARRKNYCYRRGWKLQKTVFIKNIDENGRWGLHPPTH